MLSKPNILVCTDFSTSSDLAIKAANKLKIKSAGNLIALHVIDHPALDNSYAFESLKFYNSNELKQEMMSYTRNSLREQLKFCETEATGEIIFGRPFPSIMEKIKQDKIDIVVMGYSGKDQGDIHLGGISSKTIAASPVPVFVIKIPFEINRLAGLIDPLAPKEEIITKAEELSYVFSSEMMLVSLFEDHINRFLGDNKNKLKSELTPLIKEINDERIKEIENEIKQNLKDETQTQVIIRANTESNVSSQLNKILIEERVDTIVMKRHKKNILERFIIGSETRRMLDLFQGNFLILP